MYLSDKVKPIIWWGICLVWKPLFSVR